MIADMMLKEWCEAGKENAAARDLCYIDFPQCLLETKYKNERHSFQSFSLPRIVALSSSGIQSVDALQKSREWYQRQKL